MPWRALVAETLRVMRALPAVWPFALLSALITLTRVWFSGQLYAAFGENSLSAGGFVMLVSLVSLYVGMVLMAAVVYQVLENMPWQRSVKAAFARSGSLLLLTLIFGLGGPLFTAYAAVLKVLPSDLVILVVVGPLYLLIFVGMALTIFLFPWMVQACIQERLPTVKAIRRGWQVGINWLRDVGIFVLIESGVFILVWGSVYALLSFLLGRPFRLSAVMQIFQPFRLVDQGQPVDWGVFLIVYTALVAFSWIFKALTWSYMSRKTASLS